MRRQLIKKIYDGMSEEDKRAYMQLTMQEKGRNEIMEALGRQQVQLDDIHRSQSWVNDFGANLAGNAVWDGLVWIGSRLFRKL